MSDKSLEPFVSFLEARAQFDRDLKELIREFEESSSCRVTEIDVGGFVRDSGKWYRRDLISSKVEF